jgi:hypothetical protein
MMLTNSSVLRAAVLFAVMAAGDAGFSADYELLSTVLVSRHGVRSPIGGHPPLATVAADPWPVWPVQPGHLTPRGAALAKLLGTYYREYYAAQRLFPASGCPPKDRVFAWADVAQRTMVTAQSFLEGMFPGCNIAVGSLGAAKVCASFPPKTVPPRAELGRTPTGDANQAWRG